MRPGLITGTNVDAVDIAAGMKFAAEFGYTSPEHQLVAEYALARWARGEEDGAVQTFLSEGFSLTDVYAIIAHAVAQNQRME